VHVRSSHAFRFPASPASPTSLTTQHKYLDRLLDVPEPARVEKNAVVLAKRVTLENMGATALGEPPGADRTKLIKEIVPSEYQAQFTQP